MRDAFKETVSGQMLNESIAKLDGVGGTIDLLSRANWSPEIQGLLVSAGASTHDAREALLRAFRLNDPVLRSITPP